MIEERKNNMQQFFISILIRKSTTSKLVMALLAIILVYSDLKLLTGLLTAALIAWKLTVSTVITTAPRAATAHTCQLTDVR
jgi:hypothetical protein